MFPAIYTMFREDNDVLTGGKDGCEKEAIKEVVARGLAETRKSAGPRARVGGVNVRKSNSS
jgi:hypothetical protein